MTRKDALLRSLLAIANRMGELKKNSMDSAELNTLTVAGLHYIETIADRQSVTMAELAQAMGVSKPSTTNMVNKLIEAGLVHKVQSSEDRRVFNVRLSDKGKRVMDQHRAAFEAFVDHAAEKLSDGELASLIALLSKIN